MRVNIALKWRIRMVFVALILTLVVAEKQIERLGDAYQIALPVIGLGCSLTNGTAVDFALRYGVQLTAVHSGKWALGKRTINQRPRGGFHGMPSGHTATAFLGASKIARDCVGRNPVVRATVWAFAGFVGASRVSVGAHTIWQVLIGALVGVVCDRAFRGALSRVRQLRKGRRRD